MSLYLYDMLYASKDGKHCNYYSILTPFLNNFDLLFRGKGLTKIGGSFVLQPRGEKMTRDKTAHQTNPRYKNGTLRRKHRARFKALGLPCAICGGPIHYDEPSDAQHPLSFVIDEIIPVSKYWLGGYPSKEACAQDWNNLQAVHYICNASKGAKLNYKKTKIVLNNKIDGDW